MSSFHLQVVFGWNLVGNNRAPSFSEKQNHNDQLDYSGILFQG